MKIIVKIFNGYINEGGHKLVNVNGEFVWMYQFDLTTNLPILHLTKPRDYFDVSGEWQFGLPFFKDDLDNIQW